jgi:hypothetical protein
VQPLFARFSTCKDTKSRLKKLRRNQEKRLPMVQVLTQVKRFFYSMPKVISEN